MQIRNNSRISLILCLISINIIYPFFTNPLITKSINRNSEEIQEIDLNLLNFEQNSLLEWNDLIKSVDKDKNGINDHFEKNLELIAEYGFISYSNDNERSETEYTEGTIVHLERDEIIIKKESIPVVISFPEGNYNSIKELFEKLGGLVTSTYEKAINGFAGSIDYDTLFEFSNELNINNIPYIIEEDALYEAQLYYTTRNMNLRPYVWNNLSYDGDFFSSIAVIDTGIDDSHDFFGLGYSEGDPNYKIIGWQDMVNSLSTPYDDNSHGTHCSGIATGIGTPNYDYLDRSVSTASYELSSWNTGLDSPGTYEVNWARFNVTNPGVIEIPTEFEDSTPSPDDVDFYGYLYFEDTLVASYINDSDTWMHNLSYTVPSTDLGLYSFRFDLILDDGDDGYVYDWDIKFRSEIHWPFSPNLYGSGDPWIGIAPDAHLVGVKVLDQYGSGTLSDIIDGINWVISNKNNYNITTISMSLGGPSGQTSMISAVNNAVENGIVTVVAAGNSGPIFNHIGSPGDADNVITVASMSIDDQITSYSSQGGNSYTGSTMKPDITAPGGSFYNLQMYSADTNDNDAEGGYPTEGYIDDLYGAQGTSMATPAVAGAVNVLIEAMGGMQSWGFTGTEAKRVKSLMLMSATETYPLQRESPYSEYSPTLDRGGKDVHEGYGRTNLDIAIEAYTQQLTLGSLKSSLISSSDQDPFTKHGLGCYVNLLSGNNYIFTLDVPTGADFDLHLYSNNPSSIGEPIMLKSSTSSTLGEDEVISYTPTENGKYYLIAKAISGTGNATIRYPTLDHDLGVSVEVPSNPEVLESYVVNATVYNNGENDETSVSFYLYLDEILVNSAIIPDFSVGSSKTINYTWFPTEYKTYNFTAYAQPVSGETILINNKEIKLVQIMGSLFYEDFESDLSKWENINGLWHLTNSSSAWPNPYYSPIHSMWFGNETTGTFDTGYREFGNFTSIPIDLSDLDSAMLEFYHWKEVESNTNYDVSYVYISIDGFNWEEIYISDANISPWQKESINISNYCGNSSVQFMFYFDTYDSLYNDYRGWLVDDIQILGTGGMIPEHDLEVTLNLPSTPKINNSYIINAVITNKGNNTENTFEFILYLNELIINDKIISSLDPGNSEILNYNWTPTEYGTYNFTAYAPPVENETIIYNNIVIEILRIIDIKLFDGLYLNHTLNLDGTIGPSGFEYTEFSGNIFHLDWFLNIGMLYHGYWDENGENRIMLNSGGDFYFGNSYHTPIWIFNDVNLNDTVPIAVDGEGDHIFNVSRQIYYELPNTSIVEALELIDLTQTGGIAIYEKSTGFLLEGVFYFDGGSNFYEFEFNDTNANFNYVIFDHELKLIVEVPGYCELDSTYLITATVFNEGTLDEADVELYLYLNEVQVNYTSISNLDVGANRSITYNFTPISYDDYNFTANTPPVSGEIFIDNNEVTKIVPIKEIKLIDNLYINYLMSAGELNGPARVDYSYLMTEHHIYNRLFHVKFTATLEYYFEGTWDVDAYTRIMTNNQGNFTFGINQHTPLWIFTDISIGDLISIASYYSGDHIYNCTGELAINIPGYGDYNVWVLEDLLYPGGFAWYEKSTGILLNGTFMFTIFTITANYSLEFSSSNLLSPQFPPGSFVLSSLAGTPDDDGNFDLLWNSATNADNYSVYQSISFISEINGELSNIAYQTGISPLSISGLENGTYYYIVVAHNRYGDTLSNCIEVVVSIPSPPTPGGISGYNLIFVITIVSLVSIFIVKKRINHLKNNL
ncbi:MAG: S8 family serine peptidase [Promethearchaeota archaeon]